MSGLLLCISSLDLKAQSANDTNTQCATVNIVKKRKDNIGKPKAPSMQQIFCYYEDGELTFDFAIPEGDCALTVTDLTTNLARNYSFSSEAEATVYVGTLTEAYIEIATESGHEYEGYLGQNDY